MTEADFSEVPAVLGLHVLTVRYRGLFQVLCPARMAALAFRERGGR